jgi:hypothetical protein
VEGGATPLIIVKKTLFFLQMGVPAALVWCLGFFVVYALFNIIFSSMVTAFIFTLVLCLIALLALLYFLLVVTKITVHSNRDKFEKSIIYAGLACFAALGIIIFGGTIVQLVLYAAFLAGWSMK